MLPTVKCCLIVIIGCAINAFGEILIKYSDKLEKSHPIFKRRKTYKRPLCILGNIIAILATVFSSMIGSRYGPTTLIMPLGASHIPFSVVYSHFILRDPITKQSLLGTLWVLVGVLFTALSTKPLPPITHPTITSHVLSLPLQPTLLFLIPFILLLAFNLRLVLLRKSSFPLYETAVSIAPALFGVFTNLSLRIISPHLKVFPWTDALSYPIALFCLFSALSQLLLLNWALKLLKASAMIPVTNSTLILLTCMGGVVVFEESFESPWMFAGGVMMILSGLVYFGRLMHKKDVWEEETTMSLTLEGEMGKGWNRRSDVVSMWMEKGGRGDEEAERGEEREKEDATPTTVDTRAPRK